MHSVTTQEDYGGSVSAYYDKVVSFEVQPYVRELFPDSRLSDVNFVFCSPSLFGSAYPAHAKAVVFYAAWQIAENEMEPRAPVMEKRFNIALEEARAAIYGSGGFLQYGSEGQ